MLPISVKLLRRLYLYFEEIFCSVFTTLCGLLVSQIFVWGLRIPLPPPPTPPPYLCSAVYVLFYWKFALRTWLQKQLGFSHWLRTRARMQAGKGKVWTGGKNGEWVWWEWVSHSWRSTLLVYIFFAFGSSLNTIHGVAFLLVVHKSC